MDNTISRKKIFEEKFWSIFNSKDLDLGVELSTHHIIKGN